MYQEDREDDSDPLSAEALLAAQARRRLIEHELDERRFSLFQRKVLLAITVTSFVLSAVAAMFDHLPLLGITAAMGAGSGGALMRAARDERG